MAKVRDLHRQWMKNKDYHKAHEDLAGEYELARAVIQARITAGLKEGQPPRRNLWPAETRPRDGNSVPVFSG